MRKTKLTICIILMTSLFLQLMAQDAGLSVQGVLRTAEGTAVENGNYSLTFKLYTVASGGSPLWEETQGEVSVRGGIYSAILGDVNPLTAAFDEKYYLGISVEGGAELIPRAELTSSPYALSLIGEDNVFPSSGNVGVGDASPSHKLTVKKGAGRIGIDALGSDYRTTIIAYAGGVVFNNESSSNKGFAFQQNGDLRMEVRESGLFVKGDGRSFAHFEGANTVGQVGMTSAASTIMNITNTNGNLRLNTSDNHSIRLFGNTRAEKDFTTFGLLTAERDGAALRITGIDHGFMEFYPKGIAQGRSAYLGFDSSSNNNLTIRNEKSNGDIALVTNSGNINLIPGGGRQITANGYLRLHQFRPESLTNYDFLNSNGTGYNHGTQTHNFSLYADHNIRAIAFFTDSDRRIKKDLKRSNRKSDLETLNKIEVTDYRHIDEVEYGSEYRKGLIAQQVDAVFPEAITRSKSIIPNIFEFPSSIETKENKTIFTLSKKHDLAIGDKVKMITNDGEVFSIIAEISSPNAFTITDLPQGTKTEKIFVYGKEVDDFHTVDYDRVFTLCVSAVQELSDQIDLLKKENIDLKSEKTNTKAELKALNSRMNMIEDLFKLTGNK